MVIIGGMEAAAWASRAKMFFVNERDLTEDMTPFFDLSVVWRTHKPDLEMAQRMAMAGIHVSIFRNGRSEFL